MQPDPTKLELTKVGGSVAADVLRTLKCDGGWWAFFHFANRTAARLHEAGLVERRHWDRPQGGFEYRITPAGRQALGDRDE